MNINGICYIAAKWDEATKSYSKTEKDFKRSEPNAYGKPLASGKITWGDQSKDKNGTVTKNYTTKSFACFDPASIDTLEACKNDLLLIEGQLKGESYVDKNGDKKKVEKVYISKASRYDKSANSVPQPSRNEDNRSQENWSDDIPF